MNERTSNSLIFIILLLIFVYFVVLRSPILNPLVSHFFPSMFEKHLLGSALLILLSIISINKPLQFVDWKGIVLIPQLLMGLGIVIVGFIHPIGAGYQTFGFMLLFIFPCLYFVWNNRRDYDLLFTLIIYAMFVANLGLFVLDFYFASKGQITMEGTRCAGIMGNSNCYSLVGLELVLGALYLLVTKELHWIQFIISCIAAGAGLGIMITGQMRLAIIILFFCVVASIIFYICKCSKNYHKVALHILVGLIIMAQMLLLSFALVQINNEALNPDNQVANSQTEATQDSSSVVDRFEIKGKDMNSFSSGRIDRWKIYAKELNLTGNDFDKYDLDKMTGGRNDYPFAHNIFFEVGYRCGIPIGILSVLTIFITGIIALVYLFSRKRKEMYLLFPIISVIAYSIEALLDCAALPFFQAEDICYYFAMIVFVDTRKNEYGVV